MEIDILDGCFITPIYPTLQIGGLTRICRFQIYRSRSKRSYKKQKSLSCDIYTSGIYSVGSKKANDFTEPYLKTILNFISITEVKFFWVKGMAKADLQETGFQKVVDSINL